LDAAALRRQVSTLTPSNYFALRAIDFAAGMEPFSADSEMVLPDDPADGQAAAVWLRERLGLRRRAAGGAERCRLAGG
jgi:hypothetical protein